MNISEVIQELEKFKRDFGDLPVKLLDRDRFDMVDIGYIIYNKFRDVPAHILIRDQ